MVGLSGVFREMMLCIRLNVGLVETIMRCVASVSFSVLVNGDSFVVFYPLRALLQGDLPSPYLFLFFAKALSTVIRGHVE